MYARMDGCVEDGGGGERWCEGKGRRGAEADNAYRGSWEYTVLGSVGRACGGGFRPEHGDFGLVAPSSFFFSPFLLPRMDGRGCDTGAECWIGSRLTGTNTWSMSIDGEE